MIKAILFDFDGLIIDTETIWFQSYENVLSSYGITFHLEEFAKFVGTSGAAFNQYLQEVAANVGVEAIRAQARILFNQRIVHENTREGVVDYLNEARELGLKIGLASSSDRQWVNGFLSKLDLLHYFQTIRTRDDVTRVKPDPELYLKATSDLEISPREAIAFEDSSNGTQAAKSAGLYCVVVPNTVTQGSVYANHDFLMESMRMHSLKEVLNIIGRRS